MSCVRVPRLKWDPGERSARPGVATVTGKHAVAAKAGSCPDSDPPTKAEATEMSVSIAGRPVTSVMDVDAPRLVTAALSFEASASSGTPSAIE